MTSQAETASTSPRMSWRAAGSMAAAAASAVCALLAAVAGGAFIPVQMMAAGLGLAVTLALWLAVTQWRPDSVEIWALAGLLWAVAAAAIAHVYPLGAKECIGWWLSALLVLAAVRRLAMGRALLRLSVVTVGVLIALTAMLEALVVGVPRVGGLLENPNVAAAILLPLAVSSVALSGRWRWLGWAVIGVLVAGLAMTGSRAAFLAVPVALLARAPRYWLRWIVPVLLLAGAALVWRWTTVTDPLAWHRFEIWRAVAQVLAERPLAGAGPAGLPDLVEPYAPPAPTEVARYPKRISNAESTVLAWLVAGGVPAGLWLVGGVAVFVARRGWRQMSADARGVSAAVVVTASFHDLSSVPVVLWWWAVLGGLVLPVEDEAVTRRTGADAVAVGSVVLAVLLWILVQPAWGRVVQRMVPAEAWGCDRWQVEPWLETMPLRRAQQRLHQEARWQLEDAGAALAAVEHALRLRPYSAELWRALAAVSTRELREIGASDATIERTRFAFTRATELDPHLPWPWLGWATLERSLGHLERARALCQRAVSVEPSFVSGWLLLARLELDVGRAGPAREALLRARAVPALRRAPLRYEQRLLAAPQWQRDALERELGRR